jgi:hypothetical protein
MQIAPVLLLLVLGGVPAVDQKCSCPKAGEYDRPHGANEIIEFNAGTLQTIRGKVTLPNGEPVNEAVVEIYEFTKADKNESAYKIAEARERKFACLSDRNGDFCLSDLPSGWYVLRIGMRGSPGFNEVFVKVRLDRSWWKRWFRSGRPLRIELPLGT